jgi:C-terminal processing protease CtpA/Prc
VPALPLMATPARSNAASPVGWLGFALRCEDCGMGVDGPAATPRWSFGSPPRVYHLEPGSPAHRAGLRNGDRIVRIDGHAITTAAGGAAFTGIRPGDSVRLGIARDGVAGELERVVVADARPALQSSVLDELRRGAGRQAPASTSRQAVTLQPLRFAGTIGTAEIEVRGRDRVAVSELVPGEEIEIIVGDTVVRVRLRR